MANYMLRQARGKSTEKLSTEKKVDGFRKKAEVVVVMFSDDSQAGQQHYDQYAAFEAVASSQPPTIKFGIAPAALSGKFAPAGERSAKPLVVPTNWCSGGRNR
eukprot:SAG31_NODE_16738_length_698_cov_0.806344_1_plen_103_part_00